MAARMLMGRDCNGYVTYGLQLNAMDSPSAVENVQTTLSSGVAQQTTVPSSFEVYQAVFSFETGTDVWVAVNDTAEVPSGSFAATSSQQNPAVRVVNRGDVISLITSNTTATVGVSFYGIE